MQPDGKSASNSRRTLEEWDPMRMKRIKNMVMAAALVLGVVAGWQAGSSELANMELQEDLRDLASPVGAYTKYAVARSDEDLREAVIRKAEDHDIALKPNQVTVQRRSDGTNSTMYLAADYQVPVTVPGFSFVLHFTPSSTNKMF